MASGFLLCLDFDGVICDSARECFVSSWLAHHRLAGAPPPAVVPVDLYGRFRRLRPFIRSGPDYVLIQKLLAEGVEVECQEAFDRRIAALGTHGMGRMAAAFYAAREELLADDRDYWLALNPLFAHMREPLARFGGDRRVFIVSSKRPDFILEILSANGIKFPAGRAVLADRVSKLEVVERLLEGEGFHRAWFIDDQIDHLRPNRCERIYPMLAAWGYIREEWRRTAHGVELLDAAGMLELFARLRS